MKKLFALMLCAAMLMTCAAFPASATVTEPGSIYYGDGIGEQSIYLTPNADGTAYEIDTTKHPDGVTIYVGDKLVIEEPLSAYDGDISEYVMTINKATGVDQATEGDWLSSSGSVDRLYPAYAGATRAYLTSYVNTSGSTVTLSTKQLIINLPVVERQNTRTEELNYIDFTMENTLFHGRRRTSKPFELLWHASGIEFTFTGSAIGVEVTTPVYQPLVYSIDGVDGLFYAKGGTFTYMLADDLDPNVEHTVKILRSVETFTSAPTLVAAVTDATSIAAAPERDYKIQFIGDSISSGNGIEDYRASYTYQTAANLNADLQVFSCSGAVMYDYMFDSGVRTSVDGGFVIPYVYSGINWTRQYGYYTVNDDFTFKYTQDSNATRVIIPSGEYNYSYVPDIVVINLGTNDQSFLVRNDTQGKLAHNKEGFVTTYVDFLERLAELYPSAKFVCSFGMMSENQDMHDLIDEVVETYNQVPGHNETVAFHYTYMIDWAAPDNAHPGIESNKIAAAELTEFIQQTFGVGESVDFTADENGKVTLPANPSRTGMLFKGWYDEDGNVFNADATLTAGETVTLHAEFIDASDMLTATVVNGGETDDNPVPSTAKYENGLYVQGTQVRVPLSDTDPAMGLRFISVVNDDLITLLKNTDGITNVKFGTVVASSTVIGKDELVVGKTGSSDVVAEKIWRNTTTLNSNYEKFTACVTNIPEKHLTTDIVVRPYITYKDASGVTRYIYGEQYGTADIFSAAKLAYDSGKETAEVMEYLYNNIISKAKGDNDTELEW